MKQQAGIGIILALTTAMCWGALPIAMKQVLEVMAPPTVVFYRFLMASIGLGALLAIKGKLPPMRIFRKPRWLVLLAIATGGLFGNFILFGFFPAIPQPHGFSGHRPAIAGGDDGG